MSNLPNPKAVLTVDKRDKFYGVCRRACANSEPGFVVYSGAVSGEAVAYFHDQQDAEEYARFKNRKAPA